MTWLTELYTEELKKQKQSFDISKLLDANFPWCSNYSLKSSYYLTIADLYAYSDGKLITIQQGINQMPFLIS